MFANTLRKKNIEKPHSWKIFSRC